MKIKALKAFVIRNASNGNLTSVPCGAVVDMDSTPAAAYISAGLAEAYTLVTPTGKISISGTAEVDCSAYATAQVVDEDLVAENIKKDVNILGVVGTYEGGGVG